MTLDDVFERCLLVGRPHGVPDTGSEHRAQRRDDRRRSGSSSSSAADDCAAVALVIGLGAHLGDDVDRHIGAYGADGESNWSSSTSMIGISFVRRRRSSRRVSGGCRTRSCAEVANHVRTVSLGSLGGRLLLDGRTCFRDRSPARRQRPDRRRPDWPRERARRRYPSRRPPCRERARIRLARAAREARASSADDSPARQKCSFLAPIKMVFGDVLNDAVGHEVPDRKPARDAFSTIRRRNREGRGSRAGSPCHSAGRRCPAYAPGAILQRNAQDPTAHHDLASPRSARSHRRP